MRVFSFQSFNENNYKEKLYFAHPTSTYETKYEAICISIIKEYGFNVLNPGEKAQQEDFKRFRENNPIDYMKYFKFLVNTCNGLAYLPFSDGKIGAGIKYEAEISHKNGGDIYEIDMKMRKMFKVSIEHVLNNHLSVDETRQRLKDLKDNYKYI